MCHGLTLAVRVCKLIAALRSAVTLGPPLKSQEVEILNFSHRWGALIFEDTIGYTAWSLGK